MIPRAPGLRPLLIAEIVSTTGAAMTAIALPWLVLSTTGSPVRAGLVAAVEWLPMALLGIPSGALAARLGPRRTMILCDAARLPVVAAIPLLHWLGALDLGPLLVLAFLVGGMPLSGLANPVVNGPSLTLVTLAVPTPLRAKAMLAFLTAALTGGGAGLFLTGPAAEAFGARQVILGAAVLSTACAAGFALATRGTPPRGLRIPADDDIVARAIISTRVIEAPMQLDGIHHITAITADAQRNVDFYARVLGLRLVKKSVNQDDPTVYHLFYGDEHAHPGLDLTFFEYPGAAPGRAGEGMIHRVVWRVAGEDALDFWAARLADEGIQGRREGESLHFADPEGLEHELLVSDVDDEPLTAEHPEVPAEHALQGFHAVRAFASDPERSRGLLEALGFGEQDAVWEARGPRRGGLYLYDAPPSERGIQGAGTVHHVAWASEDEDHEAWRGRVQQGGGHPTPVIDRHYFRSIYFREPSGVLFEIATRSPGFTVDEPLETLGEKLSIPPFLEHRRPEIEATVRPLENPRAVTS